jgi:hypothetical protein
LTPGEQASYFTPTNYMDAGISQGAATVAAGEYAQETQENYDKAKQGATGDSESDYVIATANPTHGVITNPQAGGYTPSAGVGVASPWNLKNPEGEFVYSDEERIAMARNIFAQSWGY